MNKLNLALLLVVSALVSACGGGGGGSSVTPTLNAATAGALQQTLSEKEYWMPGEILLKARDLMGNDALNGLRSMDKYFLISCGRVRCSIVKRSNQ